MVGDVLLQQHPQKVNGGTIALELSLAIQDIIMKNKGLPSQAEHRGVWQAGQVSITKLIPLALHRHYEKPSVL
jgi:hypothetical protein